MKRELAYGRDGRLSMEVSDERLAADFSMHVDETRNDPAAAVEAALAAPLDFPPLAACTVAGDKIALAVEQGIPQAERVTSAVVKALVEAGAAPERLSVVCAPMSEPLAARIGEALPEEISAAMSIETHDPSDRSKLTYLAASRAARPIYFNRSICDADVVIPLGAMRLDDSLGYNGVHGTLFPAFSDEGTQRRFRAPGSLEQASLASRRREEAAEAAWLLGVQFAVQVIPGPAGSVWRVLCGDAQRVADEGQRMCEVYWRRSAPRRASLVVATIDGDEAEQTWENVGRALYAATQAVEDHGAVLLCTQLREPPGPSLRRLASLFDAADDGDAKVLRELRRDGAHDSLTASLLIEARRRHRVYLMSDLDGETVEELGVGHVDGADEADRLGRQHASCMFLSDAHRAMVVVQS